MRYLNPKADLTFKKVFGEHPDLVISFLNALLPFDSPEEEIAEVEYLPVELVPKNLLQKNSIVDVRCKDKRSRQFIVAMQMIWSPEFKQRVLFNASKAYVRQLNFTPHTYSEKKTHVLWMRYLTEIDEQTRQVPPELLDNPDIKKAVSQLEESAFTDAQLRGYEKFWDMVSVEKTLINNAERKGHAEGRMEEQKTIVRKMKADHLPMELIAKYTGLSQEEIDKLYSC